jgi:hypothetical protein
MHQFQHDPAGQRDDHQPRAESHGTAVPAHVVASLAKR